MKDLYSFHPTLEDLQAYYERSKEVYTRVFERLGLGESTYIALASGGDFTKDYSHEFQTRCESGEDEIYRVPSTGVCYNKEVAPSQAPAVSYQEKRAEYKEVEAAGIIGVAALAKHLNIPVEQTTKTMLYETNNGKLVAAVVRGRYDINEEKLCKVLECNSVALADEATVNRVTGAAVGYAGPLNLPDEVSIIFDESCANRTNFECGANKTDHHSINVNFGRDLPQPEQFHDIKMAQQGDLFPETGETYEVFAAAEVGNIFPLGTKFTKAHNYTYTDQDGVEQPIYMGSYGIGTSRLMGILVEKFHDDNGIIWPEHVAPFTVHLIGLGKDTARAQAVYDQLTTAGVEVLWDDRTTVNAGEKFADADLIGCPYRVVIGNKTPEGQVELKKRSETAATMISIEKLIEQLRNQKEH